MKNAPGLLLACLLGTTPLSGCGDGSEGAIPAGKNTLIRVDAPSPDDFEQARMGIRITCNGTPGVPDQGTGEFDFETELEPKNGDSGQSFWQGAFDLPVGECTFTFNLSCAWQPVCIGSQSLTIVDGDNIFLDVVLVCPLSIGTFDACSDAASGASLAECRARPLDACDIDSECTLGFATALDPETLCVEGTGVTKPVVCNNWGDIDGASTVVADPGGGLWSVGVNDVPDGWSHPMEPIDLHVCDDGVAR